MAALTSAQYITSGISLAAFAICAALIAYRSRLSQRAKIISRADPEQLVRIVETTANDFGVNLGGLPTDQQTQLVLKMIGSRRLYAFFGFLLAIVVAAVCVIYIIIQPTQMTTMNVGPVTLRRGETRAVDFNLQRPGFVDVEIANIVPDWAGLDDMRRQWESAGRGNTPEVWFSICSALDDNACRGHGDQRGINGTSRKSLSAGPGSVVFFNFRENPPITLSAVVRY